MNAILVTGGAGYIGSHTCLALAQAGFVPVAYDNLSTGHAEFARFGPLEIGEIGDVERVTAVLEAYRPVAIVHFAAASEVGRSVREPLAYYRNNVAGTLGLLGAAERVGVSRIVFSSTCATYGTADEAPIRESHRQAPVNPYGRSKRMVEEILVDLGAANGLRSVILRYFNAAGADPEGRIGERHDPETHAVPLAIETMLGRREAFRIFGSDYPTPDGTCIRDFVHVCDLADAHLRAVRYLLEGGDSVAVNLGTGQGTSVAELVGAIERFAGRRMAVEKAERRPGDPPVLVADSTLAAKILGWSPRHDLASIVETAYRWHASRNA